MKKTVAVLLTVFNRKDITIKGLETLYAAMKPVADKYSFDVYMTNDGCTDGTPEAVKTQFPDVHIINEDGNLYWSGGMRKAWDVASKTHDYDFYLWFNDDANLYNDALLEIFCKAENADENIIVAGLFCDKRGVISYGAYDKNFNLIGPKSDTKPFLLNGNLVLISKTVVDKIGIINDYYIHSGGDWDYGCRALEAGVIILTTDKFVGITDRHDADLAPFIDMSKPLTKRLELLYSIKCDVRRTFHFNYEHISKMYAFKVILLQYAYAIFPKLYFMTHKK